MVGVPKQLSVRLFRSVAWLREVELKNYVAKERAKTCGYFSSKLVLLLVTFFTSLFLMTFVKYLLDI